MQPMFTNLSRLCFLLVLLACYQAFGESAWTESSFEDFRDGSFGDGGANTYVSAAGVIQTINRWDVNRDGHIDLFFVNSHPLIEMLDLSIYWGNGKDYSIRNHSYVPVNGPMWVTPGDLNADGATDLVVANYSNGTWTEMDSAIYWGQEKKNPDKLFAKRTYLPSQNCQKAEIADLNGDGLKDVVFAFSGGFWEYRDSDAEGAPSRVYWNSPQGFAKDHFTDLTTLGATDVAVGDLNGDEHPDVVFANGDAGAPSFVYFGGEKGISEVGRLELPTAAPSAVELADVNDDGQLDVVFANSAGESSVIYLNNDGNFNADNRIELSTHSAKDCAVADFNRDGHADIFFTNHQYSLTGNPRFANRMINSYLYWGSPEGFSADNRQELQTIGAWGTEAADLNSDGWTDLVVCNFQEHYSYEVPSFIYWNGPDGFSITRRTPLYEHGAQGCAVADINGDGNLDIAITSMMGGSRGDYDPCWLYYGDAEGNYSADKRISLPGREGYGQAMADLDDDGDVEILLMNQGEVTRWANELFIYWNKDGSFDPWRMSGLPSYRGLAVQVADLDKDGYLDVILSNYFPESADSLTYQGQPAPEETDPGATIYWGSADGFVVTERTSVPIVRTRAPCVADINRDGHLDLIFGQERANKKVEGTAAIYYGDGSRSFTTDRRQLIPGAEDTGTPEVADLDQDGNLDIAFAGNLVKVYYGNADGRYSPDRGELLKLEAKTMTVGDVNDDGWLDLVCPLYKKGGKRSLKSTILLGGPEGFSLDRHIELPTDGATGSMVADFNFDGRTDVLFWCHRHDGSAQKTGKFGDHQTDSFIYFQSQDGFSTSHRAGIEGKGVHYDMGVDLGSIENRATTYDYVSSPHAMQGMTVKSIAWKAETPGETAVKFQLRTAASKEKLADAAWMGSKGEDSYIDAPSDLSQLKLPPGEWIQYRAVLDTANGAASPRLSEVRIVFEDKP